MDVTLERYLATWDLSLPELIATTATSHVYRVRHAGERLALKLLTDIGKDDEQHGAAALTYFGGRGAVALIRHDDGAHLLEYVDGNDLIPMVERGDDLQATRIIAQTLTQLHSKHAAPPAVLIPLRRRFRALFNKAWDDEQQGVESIFRRGAAMAERLLETPQGERVLHGDMHHWNIRHHQQRGWLAFDPKGLYGERTFDAANTLCNPVHLPELVADRARLIGNANVLSQALGVEQDRLLAFVFAYACLSAAWSLEGEGDPTLALRVAALAE